VDVTDRMELYDGQEYVVRKVTGSAAHKAYRCPGCHQRIRPATPHTVAWPVVPTSFARDAEGLDERRHWHNACWSARHTRR
jgi:hypothetical protein